MNIPIIYGAVPGFTLSLGNTQVIVREIFDELRVVTPDIQLSRLSLPFYNGLIDPTYDSTFQLLREATGFIFICSASYFGPCALMQSFLEYFHHREYADILRDKFSMIILCSDSGNEGEALDKMEKTIHYLGGYTSPGVPFTLDHTKNIEENLEAREILERHIEDFYRNLRSGRKFLIPSDHKKSVMAQISSLNLSKSTVSPPDKRQISIQGLDERVPDLRPEQEQDINEITQFFAEKYKTKQEPVSRASLFEPFVQIEEPVVPKQKTCKQKTQNLPHYFQPQLAADVNLILQINVSGEETFEGYLTIQNEECFYTDGITEYPDITILVDSTVWLDILNSRFTAQKAFMVGQLKVRGNFVFLTRFEQVFKLI